MDDPIMTLYSHQHISLDDQCMQTSLPQRGNNSGGQKVMRISYALFKLFFIFCFALHSNYSFIMQFADIANKNILKSLSKLIII
jgi:hypothetical protein